MDFKLVNLRVLSALYAELNQHRTVFQKAEVERIRWENAMKIANQLNRYDQYMAAKKRRAIAKQQELSAQAKIKATWAKIVKAKQSNQTSNQNTSLF